MKTPSSLLSLRIAACSLLLVATLATPTFALSLTDLGDRLGTTLANNDVCDGDPDIDDAVAIPTSYDVDSAHPDCPYNARSQGACGSCWAFATTTMLSLRSCIAHEGVSQGLNLSPQELVSCDTEATTSTLPPSSVENQGCDGGYLDLALKYLENQGVALEPCTPYSPDDVDDCDAAKAVEADNCAEESGTLRFKSQRCYELNSVEDIQREIMARGPVVTGFDVYENFATYTSGVHKCGESGEGSLQGGHAVVITGWGVDDDDTPFWRVLNSWGTTWGEGGTFKIRRGSDDCRFESFVLAAESQEEDAEFNCAAWGLCPSCLDVSNVGEWITDCALNAYLVPVVVGSTALLAFGLAVFCGTRRWMHDRQQSKRADKLEAKVDAVAAAQAESGGQTTIVIHNQGAAPPPYES